MENDKNRIRNTKKLKKEEKRKKERRGSFRKIKGEIIYVCIAHFMANTNEPHKLKIHTPIEKKK